MSTLLTENALARVVPPPTASPLQEAEQRLQQLLAELDGLDAELDGLSLALERFAQAYEDAVAALDAEVQHAERWLRRLRALQDGVAALIRRLQAPPPSPAEPPTITSSSPAARAVPLPEREGDLVPSPATVSPQTRRSPP